MKNKPKGHVSELITWKQTRNLKLVLVSISFASVFNLAHANPSPNYQIFSQLVGKDYKTIRKQLISDGWHPWRHGDKNPRFKAPYNKLVDRQLEEVNCGIGIDASCNAAFTKSSTNEELLLGLKSDSSTHHRWIITDADHRVMHYRLLQSQPGKPS